MPMRGAGWPEVLQGMQDDLRWHLVLRRIGFRFVEHPDPILAQQGETAKECWMTIQASTCTKTGHSHDWLPQSRVFTEQSQREGVRDAESPFIDRIEGRREDNHGIRTW